LLRSNLRLMVIFPLFFLTLEAKSIEGIVNQTIGSALNSFDLDSFLSVECSDFNLNLENYRAEFSIMGCEISISSRKCYRSALNSFDKLISINRKGFKRVNPCSDSLYENVFTSSSQAENSMKLSSYVNISTLPDTIIDAEKIKDEEVNHLSSLEYLAPTNLTYIKKDITKKAEDECGNDESCFASKSLALSKAVMIDYEDKVDTVVLSRNKQVFLATASDNQVFNYSNEILSLLPIEDQEDFRTEAERIIYTKTLNKVITEESILAEETVFEKSLECSFRASSINYRPNALDIGKKSTEKWELP